MRLLPRHLCPRSGEELINVPVLRFALLLLALSLLPVSPAPAGAAEPFGAAPMPAQGKALSSGVTPEQADAMRRLIGSDPEAAKAVEETLRKKAEEAEGGAAGRAAKGGLVGEKVEERGRRPPRGCCGALQWTKSTTSGFR